MDRKYFDGPEGWATAINLDSMLRGVFVSAIGSHPNADMILRAAAKRKMSPEKMAALLKSQGVETSTIEALMGSTPAPVHALPASRGPTREERHAKMRAAQPQTAAPTVDSKPEPTYQPALVSTTSKPTKVKGPSFLQKAKGWFMKDGEATPKPAKKPSFLSKLAFWKGKGKNGSDSKTPGKPIAKKWLWIGGVILLLLIGLGVFGYQKYSGGGYGSEYDFGGSPSSFETPAPEVVPDENLTSMTPDEKEAWATSRLNSSVTETFLTKPTSFTDFFQNFKLYLNWLLYISAILLVSFSIFSERTQAAEYSDIRHYLVGIGAAIVLITFSSVIGQWAFTAGWTTSPLIFQYVSLIVGFLINAFMQYSAFDSGNKDYSVIAAGLYIFGLLLKWWFPAEVVLSTVGFGLMLAGLVVQFFEIKRHNDRDKNALTKSIIAAVLMMIVFATVYVWIFGLLEAQITTLIIPADVAAQAAAALKLSLLVKGQIATSALVGLIIAYLFGLVYGKIFLPTRGRDGTVDIRNALMLDADASTLFVMILFLFLPWIWILPKYSLMLFG